jgi:two-component system chemotaxis response regulator CheB
MDPVARRDIVVIGASAGGVRALRSLVAGLPANFGAAVYIVVHIAPDSPGVLAKILDHAGPLPARAARGGEPVRPGTILVAPPDHHLLLTPRGTLLSRGPRENRHRPSIDVLFRSAAVAYGPRVIGVILTGLLDDGAAGLWSVKRRGGVAVVQDPVDAEFPEMPLAALEATGVDRRVPLSTLADALAALANETVPTGAPPQPNMARESAIIAEEQVDIDTMDSLGRRVPLTCPECGGALWEMDEAGPRYRCHVGHAYSLMTLADEQSTRVEAALWAALRALEEHRRIAERLARSAAERGESARASYHGDRSRETERHAEVLRTMLEHAPVAPAAAPVPTADRTSTAK